MKYSAIAISLLALPLVACGSTQKKTAETVPTKTTTTSKVTAKDTGAQKTDCSLQQVHFGYDSDELSAASRAALFANKECLREKGISGVTITGTADPRGTEEYNLALGDRRAQAVKNYLQSLGTEGTELKTHSVGEEFANGTDEGTWANDRRADFNAE